jgi:4-hydroxy-3-polyprenylbenzoate decarboxylase
MDQAVLTDTDLRGFLQRHEEVGELQRIDAEVELQLTVGAISQRLAERGGPAVHFQNVRGAGHGITLVSGMLGRGRLGLWSKFAVALGLDPKTEYRDILEEVTRRVESPIRPLQISNGQCKEVIIGKNKVDLESLAAPTLHDGDGGPYLTSWAFTIAADPDSNYVAWDLLPLMVLSKKTLSGQLTADTNVGRLFHDKYAKSGKPMPFAIVFGGGPMTVVASVFRRGRTGTTDPEIAGSLQRSPIQLVKCETSDLLVPANAEMILEGVVHADKMARSGPFASSFGYRMPTQNEGPVFEVSVITHRQNPILPFCAWGTPTSDIHIVQGLDRDSQLKAKFENTGAPVSDVFSPPWLSGSVVAVSTQVPYTAYSQAVAGVVRTTEGTKNVPYIFVCDDDIDITSPVDLFHALVTKCHPHRDTWIIKNSAAAADAPYLTPGDKSGNASARAIFDCTWPLDWDRSIAVPPKVSFDQCYPKVLQEKVLRDWVSKLGFPEEAERPV